MQQGRAYSLEFLVGSGIIGILICSIPLAPISKKTRCWSKFTRMKLYREFAVGFLDFEFGGCWRHLQCVVVSCINYHDCRNMWNEYSSGIGRECGFTGGRRLVAWWFVRGCRAESIFLRQRPCTRSATSVTSASRLHPTLDRTRPVSHVFRVS